MPLALESHSIAFRFYIAPVMLHFIAGVLLYYFVEALPQRPTWRPPRWTMCVTFFIGFVDSGILPDWAGAFWLPLPSSLIVVSAIFLFDGVELSVLRLLGDASYSIYLFHILAFVFARQVISWSGLSAVRKWEVLANFTVYLIASANAMVLVHIVLEKPIPEYALSLLWRKPSAASALKHSTR